MKPGRIRTQLVYISWKLLPLRLGTPFALHESLIMVIEKLRYGKGGLGKGGLGKPL